MRLRAWQQLKGSKWPVWLAHIATMGVSFGVIFIFGILIAILAPLFIHAGEAATAVQASHPILFVFIEVAMNLVNIVIVAPFLAGIFMVGIERARGKEVNFSTGFHYFHRWLAIAGATILVFIIILLIVQR